MRDDDVILAVSAHVGSSRWHALVVQVLLVVVVEQLGLEEVRARGARRGAGARAVAAVVRHGRRILLLVDRDQLKREAQIDRNDAATEVSVPAADQPVLVRSPH